MDCAFEQQVRDRAYFLWLDDGGAHGRADHYWFQAVRDIHAEIPAEISPAVTPKLPQKRKPTAASSEAESRKAPRAPRKRIAAESAMSA